MRNRFKQHIQTHYPHLAKQKLLIACSGGADSMVLAHLAKASGYQFALAHCNYKLRGTESDLDEQAVLDWGAQQQIQVFNKTFNIAKADGSIQLLARDLRYGWFKELMATHGYNQLLTAHHLDDNVETFLINLSRGTGLEGLTGIPAQQHNTIRPLLIFSKAEILSFAKAEKLVWREDQSNTQTKYLRNKIRHNIIPALKETNPNFLSNFKDTVGHLQLSAQMLQNHIDQLKSQLFSVTEDGILIAINPLKKLHPLNGYLFELFREYGFTQWADLTALLTAQSGKEIRSSSHQIIKNRNHLLLRPLAAKENVVYDFFEKDFPLQNPISLYMEPVSGITATSPNVLYVDKKKLKYPLKLRKWKNGDYFYPFGMSGKKKLSKYFKDEKYSTQDKEKQWLLCSGENIVWVLGKRTDQRFKVTDTTKAIIKFTWTT